MRGFLVLSTKRSFAEQPVLIGHMRVSKADGSQTLDLQRDTLPAAVLAYRDLVGNH